MPDKRMRWTSAAALLIAALLTSQADAEVTAINAVRRIYPAVGRRHWILTECAKVDPARKMKYDEARRSFDQANSALMQKVRAILIADARKSKPGISAQEVLATYDRWLDGDQNKMNQAIQFGDPEQFRQQCDYIVTPAGRSRRHMSKQWEFTLIGLPAEQYPEEAKAIMSWDPKQPQ